MRILDCAHCGKIIGNKDTNCPHCGMPLAPHKRKSPQGKFIWWFIAITIFCIAMMVYLPSFNSANFSGSFSGN